MDGSDTATNLRVQILTDHKDSLSSSEEGQEEGATALDGQIPSESRSEEMSSSTPTSKVEETSSGEQHKHPRVETKARFTTSLASLQVKTQALRTKLNMQQHQLHQHAVLVQTSPEARERNDQCAALYIQQIGARLLSSNYPPPLPMPTEYSNAGVRPALVPQQLMPRKQQTPRAELPSTFSTLTRQELEEQVEALQQLLGELTTKHPQLKPQVLHLAAQNPKLWGVDLFPKRMAAGSGASQSSSSQYGVQREHNDSEVSVSSTATGSNRMHRDSETSNGSAGGAGGAGGKRIRKRNPRQKNKRNKPPKCQESERVLLAKYINTILKDFMAEQHGELAAELQFKAERDADDLEGYAQKLVQAGLGRIVEDEIRVNRKNNRQSFITMSADREGPERDGIVLLPVARRYAFDGDTVRAFVLNPSPAAATNGAVGGADEKKSKSPKGETITGGKDNSFCLADDDEENSTHDEDDDESPLSDLDTSAVALSDNCPKAFIISIVCQSEQRQVVGSITFKSPSTLNDEDHYYYKLKPHDMRVPMVYIPVETCVQHASTEDGLEVVGLLFLARITETDAHGHCRGELLQKVGHVGNLEAEIKAILLHNGMRDMVPYEQRFNDMYALPDPPLTADDFRQRKDLRKKCVFTIDPLTARDLDDAVSVDRIAYGEYEVGVHISDVSHYLQERSELDEIVKDRATSVYLVNEVIHMLPQSLCFKCSLLPGEDKLAFSVFWRINLRGEVLGPPRFARTIINSCTQFAYEHAQLVIDHPHDAFGEDNFPPIYNGFEPVDISERIRILHAIAEQLRAKRYEGGALSINNPKLRFSVDTTSGEPLNYEVDAREEANFLIEEFMLLANQSVARFIYDRYPDIAILRHHAPPLAKSMRALREKLGNVGIVFDPSSSKSIFESMQSICSQARDPAAMDACLSTLLTKPMARAKYFCSEGKTAEADLWHYALSIPIYTHFTSPIRRYPDILVHRLLAAALNYGPAPTRTCEELHEMAKVCNDQKFNARNAGDDSVNLFFKRYIKAKQSLTLRAAVTEIFRHVINVVTIETGHNISINYKMQKVLVDTTNAPAYILISEKNSRLAPLKLQLFSAVDVRLVIWDGKICGFFASPDLKQRQLNTIEASKKKQADEKQRAANNQQQSRSKQKSKRHHENVQQEVRRYAFQ